MKSGLEDRNNSAATPTRQNPGWVSMKSGLEDRNNETNAAENGKAGLSQ